MMKLLRSCYPEANITGFDLLSPPTGEEHGILNVQANIASLPLAESSVSEATMFWSVLNDLANPQLLAQSMVELRRVMENGGRIYVGTPNLEGGEKSWLAAVESYHRQHPDEPFGMVELTIDDRGKKFNILPQQSIIDLFGSAGFRLVSSQEWTTGVGKPRRDYVFELSK